MFDEYDMQQGYTTDEKNKRTYYRVFRYEADNENTHLEDIQMTLSTRLDNVMLAFKDYDSDTLDPEVSNTLKQVSNVMIHKEAQASASQ